MAASIIIRFGGNLDDLKKAIDEGRVLIENSTRSMDKLASRLRGDKAAQDAEKWAGAIKNVDGALKLTAADAEKANQVFQKSLEYYRAQGKEAPEALRKVAAETKAVVMQNRALEESARRTTEALRRQGETLQAVGQGLSTIGRGLTVGVTVPIVGVMAGATKAAIDFETAFAGVRKTVGGSKAELDKISLSFRELSKTVPLSAAELSRIGEMAGQLGVQRGAIVTFTKTIADIATATNLTADEAGAAFARLANIMKLPQEQFDRLGSAVVALGNYGASTEQEMLDMGLRLAGAGATIGLTVPQVLGLANALSSVGLEAEAGGTAMSRVMVQMAAAVTKGTEQLRLFAAIAGVSVAEFQRLFREDAGAAIVAFIEGLGKIKASGGNLLGTIEALGMTEVRLRDALLRSANAADLVRTSVDLGNRSFRENTELTRAAGERYGTAGNQLKLLRNQLEDVGIQLGTVLVPMLIDLVKAARPVLDALAGLVARFSQMPRPVQTAVVAIAGIAAALGPIVLVVGQAVSSLGMLFLVLDKIKTARMAGAAAEAVSGIGSIGAAAGRATPLLLAFKGALAAAVIGFSAVEVTKAIQQTIGLLRDREQWARDAAGQNATHLRMLQEASRIAKREITDIAEGQRILAQYAAELRAKSAAAAAGIAPGKLAVRIAPGAAAAALGAPAGAGAPAAAGAGAAPAPGMEGWDQFLKQFGEGAGGKGETPAQKAAKDVAELGELWAAASRNGVNMAQLIDEQGSSFLKAGQAAQIWGVKVTGAFAQGLAAAQAAKLDELGRELSKDLAEWQTKSRKAWGEQAKEAVDAQAKAMVENLELAQEYQDKVAALDRGALATKLAAIDAQEKAALRGVTIGVAGAAEATAAIKRHYQQQRDQAVLTAGTIVAAMRAAGVGTRDDLRETAEQARRAYELMAESGKFAADDVYAAWRRWYEADRKYRQDSGAGWLRSVSALTDAFVQLAQAGGESLAALAQAFGTLQASLRLVADATDQIKLGIAELRAGFTQAGFTDLLGGIMGAVGAVASNVGQIGKGKMGTAMGIGGMALTGAAIGSIIPGIGTAIGAAVGAIAGAVTALIKALGDRTKKDLQRKMKEWGLESASDELIKTIEADVKKLGGEVEASLYHLGDIIREAGGVTAENYQLFLGKLRDVFVMVSTAKFDVTKARKVLDENFAQFEAIAREVAKKTGGALGPELRELIGLDKAFGTASKAIADLVTRETQAGVAGLVGYFQQYKDASAGITEKRQQLADATAALAKATTAAERSELQKQVDELTKGLAEQERVVGAFTVHTQAQATGFAAALAGSFAALQRQGLPVQELLAQFEPAVAALQEQLGAGGFEGGAAFDQLRAQIALVKDAVTGPLIQGITNASQGLVGLFNANVLTPEMWAGLTSQVGEMFAQFGEQGGDAMRILQPQLQGMWEIWKETGWAIDDQTKAILQQAEAEGLVGEQRKTAQQQMLDGVNRIAVATEGLARAFGVELPQATKLGADALDELGRQADVLVAPDLTPTIDTEEVDRELRAIKRDFEGLEVPPIDVGIEIDPWYADNPFPDGGTWEQQQAWREEAARHNRGMTVARFHAGGLVGAGAPEIMVRAHGGLAPDEFPALLTAGERVLNPRDTAIFDAALATAGRNGEQAAAVLNVYQIAAMDAADVQQFFERKGLKAWTQAVRVNPGHIAPELKAALQTLLGL